MARAKLVKPRTPPPEVQLTLTRYEAETLLHICGRCAGWPAGRRGAIDRITEALESARVEQLPLQSRGDIFFTP